MEHDRSPGKEQSQLKDKNKRQQKNNFILNHEHTGKYITQTL